ncbi:leucine-rich repeat flightless-interacting protein 2-like [Anopheles darlingi]|uniref:leucine-rich repeat flightless-interacting protein 2-like n=1 Tax=Anopheles darlingi TaxID=43151 RepID=UPI0021004DA4|nr:leucine-rich repeat flightless-interacting protein 2-like [Anopheles darlingi]
MVQIKQKVVQCEPPSTAAGVAGVAVGRFAVLLQKQKQQQPAAGPSLSDCLERAESGQPSRLAVKGGTWHYGEARLAAVRQARAEAREIRMLELERNQRQQQQQQQQHEAGGGEASGVPGAPSAAAAAAAGKATRGTNVAAPSAANTTSARIARAVALLNTCTTMLINHTTLPVSDKGEAMQTLSTNMKELSDCFNESMIKKAELENENTAVNYQNELLRDELDETLEKHCQLQRENREKLKECSGLKRDLEKLQEELRLANGQVQERDALITQHGLLIVSIENQDGSDARRMLLSAENSELLGSVSGSLDARLSKFAEEKARLETKLQEALDELNTIKAQRVQPEEMLNENALHETTERLVVGAQRVRLRQLATENGSFAKQIVQFRDKLEAVERAGPKATERVLHEPTVAQFWDECHCQ